jgi:N,N-dimethylformamidase
MAMIQISGYGDKISITAGERIRFMVSLEGTQKYRAEIVRLINGNDDPAGPGAKEELIATPVNSEYEGRFQPIYPGSHVVVDDDEGLLNLGTTISVHTFLMPTTPMKGAQAIMARWNPEHRKGWALLIDDGGRLMFTAGNGAGQLVQATAPNSLLAGVWYSAGASYDRTAGRATVHLAPVINSVNSLIGRVAKVPAAVTRELEVERVNFHSDSQMTIAGWAVSVTSGGRLIVDGHFNGKIDRPRVYGHALGPAEFALLAAGREPDSRGLVARWDFADGIGPDGIPTDKVTDTSGNDLHGRCVNTPARAETGYNWQGREEHFIHAASEYGAIHFHDDDLEDAGWETSFELLLPESMRSAIYAAKLTAGDSVDYIPFAVHQPAGRPTAKIAFLMPTASYMAYSNELLGFSPNTGEPIVGHPMILGLDNIHLFEHPELGLSTYDHHSDGSGVCYVSRLRPIPNLRPHHLVSWGAVWGLGADLHLIDWLTVSGFEHDIITDEDLHRDGLGLLCGYKVVLTGTHPEYYSSAMLDALESYLNSGGRLMYLGGNGFYWVTSYHPEKPYLIEVRKGESGSRAWQAVPGEYYHSTTGERGGLWRNRARAPQKLVGVGFAAQGFDRSSYYARMPDGFDRRVSFIFQGIGAEELIGNFGLIGNGAAGHEIDRYDRTLGTPPNTMLLASSEGHTDSMQRVVEEIYFNYPGTGGTQDPGVHGDICYFTTSGGGAVFSAGSIAWCGSLSHNNYDNNVSRITANVLNRFASNEPLDDV